MRAIGAAPAAYLLCLLLLASVDAWGFHSPEEATQHPSGDSQLLKDGVYELTESTFSEFISSEPSVLILFYAPWCHWCRDFLPKFSEAAKIVESQKLAVKFAQIDASRYMNISDTYEVTGFPTLKLFLDSVPHKFDGNRRTLDLVTWLSSHLQTELTISSAAQLDAVLTTNSEIPTLVAHFDKSSNPDPPSRQAYIALSRLLEHVSFTELDDPSAVQRLISEYGAPSSISSMKEFIIMMNPHAKSKSMIEPACVLYPGIVRAEPLKQFIRTFSFPAVVNFDANIAPLAFKDGRPIWVLFSADESTKQSEKALAVTQRLATKYRADMIFVYSDGHSVFDKRLQSLLGIENEKFPTVRLFHTNPNGHSNWYSTLKYRPSLEVLDSFDEAKLDEFIVNFQNSKLKPFIRSEPIPDPSDNTGAVKTLVADQFEELVEKSPKDVFVEFYAPWCGHCRKLEPTFRQLGQVLSKVPHVDVMKMDATQNEINVMIMGYPTLILFSHDAKTAGTRNLYYNGDRSLEDMVKWIAEHSTKKFNADLVLHPPKEDPNKPQSDWSIEEL